LKNHLKLVKFNKAVFKSNFNNHLIDKARHNKINDVFLNEIILRNFCEIKKMSESEKNFNLSNFILGIQKDISVFDDNYQYKF